MSHAGSLQANVVCTRTDHGAVLTVGDGRRLNALRSRDWAELERVALVLSADPSVSSVVIRGLGGVFCSGSDLREWSESEPSLVEASFVQMERALQAVENIPVPTVAFVEKVAAGAGCQLALACDLQVLTASSRIGMPIIRLGILTPPAFAFRLTARVGASRAKRLLFGGELLTADEALRIGLVTHAPPDGSARSVLDALLGTWSRMPGGALRAAKASVQNVAGAPRGPEGGQQLTFVDEFFSQRVAEFLAGSR